MRRNMKQEFNASMDTLHFSRETKEDMVELLMSQTKEINMTKKRSSKRIFFIALAAALVLATMTGAAVFTRWSRSMQGQYNPSQEIKEHAQKSGLSVMLEENTKETSPDEIISVTDQGITVTAVQSIVDSLHAHLTFRIEGLELPENVAPACRGGVISINGKQGWPASSGGFYNGVVVGEDYKAVYADGSPIKTDENGNLIVYYYAEDGSLEYNIDISFADPVFEAEVDDPDFLMPGEHLGSEIVVRFSGFGHTTGKAMDTITVDGDWTLKWTLTGSEEAITVEPNAEIGDSGVILQKAEISPISIALTLKDDAYWDGWKTLESFSPAFCGFRMKDGSVCLGWAASGGYQDVDNLIYRLTGDTFGILDVGQVESLMFHKGWEKDENGESVELFYYIPIA